MIYLILKDAHNVMRWLVLLAALWALFRSWRGLVSGSVWSPKDRSAGLIFSSVLNLQFVVGILLYCLSPLTNPIFTQGFKYAMSNPVYRFFTVEHPFTMLMAVILAQIGYSASKRAPTDRSKFLRASIAFTLALILILVAIPWPGTPQGRPLLPGLGN